MLYFILYCIYHFILNLIYIYIYIYIYSMFLFISSFVSFFPQHQVVCLLNSARECVRPSLLVFLFSEPPYPAGIVVIIIVVGPSNGITPNHSNATTPSERAALSHRSMQCIRPAHVVAAHRSRGRRATLMWLSLRVAHVVFRRHNTHNTHNKDRHIQSTC